MFSIRRAQTDHQCDVQDKDCIGTIKEGTLYEYVSGRFKVCHRCSIHSELFGLGRPISERDCLSLTGSKDGARCFIEYSKRIAERDIDRLVTVLHLSSSTVREQAALIYANALEKGLTANSGLIVVSLYVACRFLSVPCSLNELAAASRMWPHIIAQNYRLVVDTLGLQVPLATPADYISKVADALKISAPIQKQALSILRMASIKDKSPMPTAGAALYIASLLLGQRKTMSKIAEVAMTSEVTIRNRVKDLFNLLELPSHELLLQKAVQKEKEAYEKWRLTSSHTTLCGSCKGELIIPNRLTLRQETAILDRHRREECPQAALAKLAGIPRAANMIIGHCYTCGHIWAPHRGKPSEVCPKCGHDVGGERRVCVA